MALVVLNHPIFLYLCCFALVVYQFVSGNLLNLKGDVWISRKERPRRYWTVLTIEAVFALLGVYVELH
jgi:hypothetical protein